jgi:hypothetical protein
MAASAYKTREELQDKIDWQGGAVLSVRCQS